MWGGSVFRPELMILKQMKSENWDISTVHKQVHVQIQFVRSTNKSCLQVLIVCDDDNLYLIWHFLMISISPSKRSLQHEERFAEWLSWTNAAKTVQIQEKILRLFTRHLCTLHAGAVNTVRWCLACLSRWMLIKFILNQTKQSDLQSIDYCCKKDQRHALSRIIINYWQSIADNWDNRVYFWCKSQLSWLQQSCYRCFHALYFLKHFKAAASCCVKSTGDTQCCGVRAGTSGVTVLQGVHQSRPDGCSEHIMS